MAERYFVTISATSENKLRCLCEYDCDLFAATSKRVDDEHFSIEGLLTLDEVSRLVKDGYRVTVEDRAEKRAQGRAESVEFNEWIKGMEE